jgi:LysM repeat protein
MLSKAFLAAITIAAGSSLLPVQSVHAESTINQKVEKAVKVQKVEVNEVVQEGDTLIKIANKHKTTYVRLFNANEKIVNPDIINPGDKIRIPDASEKLADRRIAQPVVEDVFTPTEDYSDSSSYTAPASKPAPRVTANYSGGSSVWDKLAQCEAGGNWSINTGNGYYGGLQFSLSSWRAAGGSGLPSQASREEQISRGKILQTRQGWGAWPSCASKLGLY